MPEDKALVFCYNRGCGQMFDPMNNDKDVCLHHPGSPIFHDAYKGWSCCNKKSVDFTEFLNIKGCALSKHSNVKPPEPEKKKISDKDFEQEVITVNAPIPGPAQKLPRPPFDSPLVLLHPSIADSLRNAIQETLKRTEDLDDGLIPLKTSCYNRGCNAVYEGPQSNESVCIHHPGSPIFHEGLKFWSCCQKRTMDFNTFLSQPGCTTGSHIWKKEAVTAGTVQCRWDWHQTPDYVIISVYAKKYHPHKSYIKMNPVRVSLKLTFPEEGDAIFELDVQLRGIITVDKCSAFMTPNKLEIKLKKAEPGTWSKLDFPKEQIKETPTAQQSTKKDDADDDIVDLDDVMSVQSMGKVNITEVDKD